jgi:hypothetical protein
MEYEYSRKETPKRRRIVVEEEKHKAKSNLTEQVELLIQNTTLLMENMAELVTLNLERNFDRNSYQSK